MKKLLQTSAIFLFTILLLIGCDSEINFPKEKLTQVNSVHKISQNLLVPQNFTTIQEAIDVAHDGDKILVSEGTYRESLIIDGKDIILKTVGDVIIHLTYGDSYGIQVYNGNVVIDGFEINASGVYVAIMSRGGVDEFGPVNLSVKNCNIYGFFKSAIVLNNPEAYGNIESNQIYTKKYHWYYIPYAIQFAFGAKGRIVNNQLSGGLTGFSQSQIKGVLLYETNNVLVKNNTISKYVNGVLVTSYGQIYQTADDNKIVGNIIDDCKYGISLQSYFHYFYTTKQAIVSNNLIANNKIKYIVDPNNVRPQAGIEMQIIIRLSYGIVNEFIPILKENLTYNNTIVGYEIPILEHDGLINNKVEFKVNGNLELAI